MKSRHRPLLTLLALALIIPLSSCVSKRTVTRNGQTMEEGLVVKLPLKEAMENPR